LGGISPRRAAVGPLRDPGELFLTEGGVVLVLLDADVFLDVPGWHRAALSPERGPRLDRSRVGPSVFIGPQRHRRERIGPMTRLTVLLQNRGDVLREGHVP